MRQKAVIEQNLFPTRLLRSWLDTIIWCLVVFGQKWPFSRCLHQGLIFADLKDFFIRCLYWDQAPRKCGKLDLRNDRSVQNDESIHAPDYRIRFFFIRSHETRKKVLLFIFHLWKVNINDHI
jgi:hypothetical protein